MRKPDLSEDQRAVAARIIALLEMTGAGAPAADPAAALPALRALTRDRTVLGDVLGDYLHRVVTGTQADTVALWPVLELLRAAGADEERAALKASWSRHQRPPGVT